MKLTKSKIFLIFCIAFVLGVLMAPYFTNLIMVFMAMIFVMLASIGWGNKYARIIGFAGLILILGVWRYQTVENKNNLASFYNKQATVTGIISEEPDVRSDKIYLTLDQIKINGALVDDKILISVYTSRNFFYGNEIQTSGKILEPKVFPDFDYKHYLSRYGVDAVMYYPDVEVISSSQGNKVKSFLLSIKQNFVTKLGFVLPEPQNAFMAGLLVGNKRSIPQDLTDAFNATGTSHIVAISGYNITIIAYALDVLFRRFGKKTSFAASILCILGFVVLTGASASVIRAAIMGILAITALNVGRLFNMTNALVITAAGMILINPKILRFDVGFQLSFMALVGIVYLSPILNRAFSFLPELIRESFVATIAAQIFTLPILIFNFDQLSLIAPLTNLLVLWLVPLTMLFGFLTGLAGFVWMPLASLLSWPSWILLSYIISIVEWTAKIPFSNVAVHFDLWAVIIYYVVIVSLLLLWVYRKLILRYLPKVLYKAQVSG